MEDFLTSTALSGIVYDFMKSGLIVTSAFLKNKLTSWLLEEIDYEKIAEIINNSSDYDKKTKESFETYLDKNEELKEILKSAKLIELNSGNYQDLSNSKNDNCIIANHIEKVEFKDLKENDEKKS